MDPVPEEFDQLLEDAGIDGESLTYLVVTAGTRASVLEALGADSDRTVDLDKLDFVDVSAYAVAEVAGGVIAIEYSGYADPSPKTLALLSAHGGSAAIARSNIQAHERFGCARDGALIFDADEFMYVEAEEKGSVPPELLPLFDAAWADPDSDEADEAGDAPSGLVVAMAMATLFTGVRATADDLRRAQDSGYHQVRTLTYLD